MSEFLKNCNNRFEKMFLFELNKNIYKKLKDNINTYNKEISEKIIANNIGLSDKEDEVYYNDDDTASAIMSNAEYVGKINTIDNVLKDEDISFIKMDIEGAEMSAIYGAEKTIKRCKPKLAICIYHSAEDLWRIPLYIKDMIPEYDIFIRHHTNMLIETVCYAIPR
jgi:FkbM family methyltransferase